MRGPWSAARVGVIEVRLLLHSRAARATRRVLLSGLCLTAPALQACHDHKSTSQAARPAQDYKDRYADGKALAAHLAKWKPRWADSPKLPDCGKLLDDSKRPLCAHARDAEDKLVRLVGSGAPPGKLLDATTGLVTAMGDATHALRSAAMGYLGKARAGGGGAAAKPSPYLAPMQRYSLVMNGTLRYLLVFLEFGPFHVREKALGAFDHFWHGHPEVSQTRGLLKAAADQEDEPGLQQRIRDLEQHPPALKAAK